MRDLQERKRIRNFLHSPVLLVALFIAVIFLIRSNYNIYKKNQITRINREESDKKLSLLKEKSDNLSALLEKLKTDRGVEEELRNKFQITKGGEEVLVVVDQDPPEQAKAAETSDNSENYWQRLKSFFGF